MHLRPTVSFSRIFCSLHFVRSFSKREPSFRYQYLGLQTKRPILETVIPYREWGPPSPISSPCTHALMIGFFLIYIFLRMLLVSATSLVTLFFFILHTSAAEIEYSGFPSIDYFRFAVCTSKLCRFSFSFSLRRWFNFPAVNSHGTHGATNLVLSYLVFGIDHKLSLTCLWRTKVF